MRHDLKQEILTSPGLTDQCAKKKHHQICQHGPTHLRGVRVGTGGKAEGRDKKMVTTLKNSKRRLWRRHWHPAPVPLPGKSHGRRSLVGCSSWGREESDTTKRLHFHFSLSCFGEGNGNPLQCSCLENPRDGGAWWAAVSGVTHSLTGLKRLSK